jgi:signal transduction histidine kinase
LRQTDDIIEVEVADDGVGFDTSRPIRAGAFGLRGMSERALLLNGSMSVESEPGHGTTVRVRLPISETSDTE